MKAYIVHAESPIDADNFLYEQRFVVFSKSARDAQAEFAAAMPGWGLKSTEETSDLSPSALGYHSDTIAA